MADQNPRIGIIGTGAIGGFYGVMLARAGYDVHFLLRSEYEAVADNGLQLNSAVHGALHLDDVQAYRNAADMPRCDWLLVGAKSTSNQALAPVINEVAAEGARVVVLQNGLAMEDQLRQWLPDSLHLLGGLCFNCVHRAALGVIEHQALGGVNLGYHSGPAKDEEQRTALLEEGGAMFKRAGLDSAVAPDLTQARWQKLIWNIPYNGLSVLLNAGTEPLMRDPHSRALIKAIMDEVVGAMRALGYQPIENLAERILKSTDRMPDYLPSMYHDHAQHRVMELDALYAAPLAAAAGAGFAMPRTEMLLRTLRFIEAASASRRAP